MIEKIPFETEKITHNGKTMEIDTHASPYDLQYKINELVDAVNAIQTEREAERFEIQEWIGIIEAVRESVNVHEKQIDELQMKAEPEKCEAPVDPYTELCGALQIKGHPKCKKPSKTITKMEIPRPRHT